MLTALIGLLIIALAIAVPLLVWQRRRNLETMRLLEYTEGYGVNPNATPKR